MKYVKWIPSICKHFSLETARYWVYGHLYLNHEYYDRIEKENVYFPFSFEFNINPSTRRNAE